MRKRILSTLIVGCAVFALSACGSKSSSSDQSSDQTGDVNLADYVTLGEYKGVLVAQVETDEVTDDEVESEIDYELSENSIETEVSDRAAEDGDMVNIDFIGYMDGEAFDGGSAEDYDLEIGSGSFIDGFEDGLLGANIGETITLNLTFPEDYTEDYANKDVTFEVTINSISIYTVPELTEEYVAENTDYDSVEAYKEAVREQIYEDNATSNLEQAKSDAFDAAYENASVEGYPDSWYDDYYNQTVASYEYMASMYGYEYDDMLAAFGMTDDDIADLTVSDIQEDMFWMLIAEVEGIEVNTDEIDTYLEEQMESYNTDAVAYGYTAYSSIDDFEEAMGGEEEVENAMLEDKVKEFIYDNADIIEVTQEEYDSGEYEQIEDQTIDESTESELIEEEESSDDVFDESDFEEVE